jgi:hypothetical protein
LHGGEDSAHKQAETKGNNDRGVHYKCLLTFALVEKTTNQNYGVGGGEDEDQKLQTQTNSNKQIVSKFPIKKKQNRRSKEEEHRKRQYFPLKH